MFFCPTCACYLVMPITHLVPELFPAQAGRRSRRNYGEPAARRPQGPNCLVPTLSRVETVIQGYICEAFNFPGASVQTGSLIVNYLVQKLVKCVGIRRKFGKFRNQFCWIRCEEYYNFCYTHLV
jgi:hypothetical protein